MRLRVLRILRGDFRADDISRLFLFARDRCNGSEPVREVGDFVAHHTERTKGIVTRTTKDWFDIATFMFEGVAFPANVPLELSMPANAAAFLGATLRRMDNQSLIQRSGLNKAQATRALEGLTQALVCLPDGRMALGECSREQYRLFRSLTMILSVQPAFSDDQLFSGFVETLKRQSLLEAAEIQSFSQLKKWVCLYAVTVMHNCVVQLPGGSTSKLFAAYNGASQKVSVSAPIMINARRNIQVAASVFDVTGAFSDLCDPQALPLTSWDDFELDVSPERKLTLLV